MTSPAFTLGSAILAAAGIDVTPLTPAELRSLAAELEESLVQGGPLDFRRREWRTIAGLEALAEAGEATA
jgi:hypothetical protein